MASTTFLIFLEIDHTLFIGTILLETIMITLGFILILLSGFSDGSFYVPAKYTKKWEWEHYWAVFSIGFFVISWILTVVLIPNIFSIYGSVEPKEIYMIMVFGALWGVGAILFGTALHMLGMALAYPITLGTVACFGAAVPLLTTEIDSLFSIKGLMVIVGMSITVIGIITCSRAFKAKGDDENSGRKSTTLVVGLLVAVFAGVFSALINIGFSFAENVIAKAHEMGVHSILSGISPWCLFFSIAFIVNFGYCLYLMLKRKNTKALWTPDLPRNFSLGIAMGALFVCAVYIYSMGATCLGSWGEVPGWIVFMSVDILTGNVWGLWMGEWDLAPKKARQLLKLGMVTIILAIIIVAIGQCLSIERSADSEDSAKIFQNLSQKINFTSELTLLE